MKLKHISKPYIILLITTITLLISLTSGNISTAIQEITPITENESITPAIAHIESTPLSAPLSTDPSTHSVIVDPATQYADFHEVSIEEAQTRLELQEEMRLLYAEIQNDPTFGGLWLEHHPNFKVVIQFTEEASLILDNYTTSEELQSVIDIRHVPNSLHELKESQSQLQGLVENFDAEAYIDIDITQNQVELYLEETDTFLAYLDSNRSPLPAHIQIVEESISRATTSNINGGLKFNSTNNVPFFSTSGFAVMNENTGVIGVTTSGHSPNTKDYLGVNLPFAGGIFSGNYDVQWHLPANYTVRNLMFNGTNNLFVTGVRHYDQQMVGETVCKYGQNTQYGCGTISSKFSSGQYIRVTHPSIDLSENGDSGGPWFVGNIAYGMMAAELDPTNDAEYMAINLVDILDLCVLRGPTSPTTPTLNGTFNNGQISLSWSNPDDICGHAIHRSTSPYFTPSDSTLVTRVKKSSVGFNTSVGVGDVNTNYTYIIRPVIGSNEPDSIRIGEFDFALFPGN